LLLLAVEVEAHQVVAVELVAIVLVGTVRLVAVVVQAKLESLQPLLITLLLWVLVGL
tara:strand:- start:539 stop:709 length:171 start_codon:yes stop_codon:yes gene_type:complete